MTFRLLEQVWDPNSTLNADWFGSQPRTVLLLDGAAPQHPAPVSHMANDAVWLVRRFVEVFQADGDGDAGGSHTMVERVERARAQLQGEYRALCTVAGFVPAEAPFACLAIAHELGSDLEFLNMGDLTLLLRMVDGTVQRFGDSAVRELDRQALATLKREIDRGTSLHADRVANVWPQIQANRALRNVVEGYDVLDPDVSCAGRMQRLLVERSTVRSFLMLSDGFYRLVDTYQRYTELSLFEAVERRGLHGLLRELRSIEAGDAACVRYLRFKQCDDATALWIE